MRKVNVSVSVSDVVFGMRRTVVPSVAEWTVRPCVSLGFRMLGPGARYVGGLVAAATGAGMVRARCDVQ